MPAKNKKKKKSAKKRLGTIVTPAVYIVTDKIDVQAESANVNIANAGDILNRLVRDGVAIFDQMKTEQRRIVDEAPYADELAVIDYFDPPGYPDEPIVEYIDDDKKALDESKNAFYMMPRDYVYSRKKGVAMPDVKQSMWNPPGKFVDVDDLKAAIKSYEHDLSPVPSEISKVDPFANVYHYDQTPSDYLSTKMNVFRSFTR